MHTVDPSERADVVMAAKGDHSAYERLYRSHRHKIFSLCLRITGKAEEAEDVSQNVFLQAYLKLPQFRGDSSLGTWLHRIAVNECLQYLRKERRTSAHLEECYGLTLIDQHQLHHRDRGGALCRLGIREALGSLPRSTQSLLFLRHIKGYTEQELTKLTGVPLGTTKARLSRGRKALREILEPSNTLVAPS